MAKISMGTRDTCRHCKRTIEYKSFGEISSWARPAWVHLSTPDQVENIYCDGTPPPDLDYHKKRDLPQAEPSGYCWERLMDSTAGSRGFCGAILREANPYFACKRHFDEADAEHKRKIMHEINQALSSWEEEQEEHFKAHLVKLLGPEEEVVEVPEEMKRRRIRRPEDFRWTHSTYARKDTIEIRTDILLDLLNAPYERPKVVPPEEFEQLYKVEEGMFE